METQERVFDFKQLWEAFRKFWYIVLASLVLCAALAGVITSFYSNAHPVYSATSRYLVIASTTTSSNSYQDTLLARERVEDIVEIIQSNKTTMLYVLQAAGMSTDRLSDSMKMISVSSSGDTSVISVTVKGSNPEDVKELMQALELYLPKYISEEIFYQEKIHLEVIDKAFLTPSSEPQLVGSHVTRNALIFGVLGCILSYAIVLVLYLRDETVYSGETLQNAFTDIPILGLIPSWENGKMNKKADSVEAYRDCQEQILGPQTAFPVAEAYRGLRTNVNYLIPGKERGVVYGITSDRNGEGKSITISNLAICFSQLNKKILLVEADMRMPSLGKFFGYVADKGLTDVLAGLEADYRSCLIDVPDYQNLQILPVGQLPPNPAELLASEQMRDLLESLRDSYDYILVDLPPVGMVSDAGVLANSIDRYLLAVRANYSETSGIRNILGEMQKISMHVGGFVLTDVPVKRKAYYYKKKSEDR